MTPSFFGWVLGVITQLSLMVDGGATVVVIVLQIDDS
jgi:hypothetical protein